jgi:hypothetical protein
MSRLRCAALPLLLLLDACVIAQPVDPTEGLQESATESGGVRPVEGAGEDAGVSGSLPLAAMPVDVTLGFDALTRTGAPVAAHAESGFRVEPTAGAWVAGGYGHPGPALQFVRQASQGAITAGVKVHAGGAVFRFLSVDFYSSMTPIPYEVKGLHRGEVVFTQQGTVPNTYGQYATVEGEHPARLVDTLHLTLTNPATPCCANPMALDTLRLGAGEVPADGGSGPAPEGDVTVGFGGLTGDRTPFTGVTEAGFRVEPVTRSWQANTQYGHPAPFVFFTRQASEGPVTGSVRVRAVDGAPFLFRSVDLYSSVTPIPYEVRGLRGGETVFTLSSQLPNTYGAFATVSGSPDAGRIDTLLLTLTNPATPCCDNPVGLDTLQLTR